MSRMVFIAATIAGLCCASPALAQDRPDFSGTWTRDLSKSVTTGLPPRGIDAAPAAGGPISVPVLIKNVTALYTAEAMRAHVTGTVMIEALIDRAGLPTNLRVAMSIPLLDQPALDAVRQWRFTPGMLNGAPVPVMVTLEVTFSLRGFTGKPAVSVPRPPTPPTKVTITQDAQSLTVGGMVYRLDGTETKRLPVRGTGAGPITNAVSRSHWDGAKLVTIITQIGTAGTQEITETRYLDGATMVVETVQPNPQGGEPIVRRYFYNRVGGMRRSPP